MINMLGHISGTFVWVTETDVVIGVPPHDLISHLRLRKSIHLTKNEQVEIEDTCFFPRSLLQTHTQIEKDRQYNVLQVPTSAWSLISSPL